MSDVGPILQQARRELLDLSGRNRLLNTPRQRSRASLLEIRGERSEAVLRLLVEDGRGLGFRPRPEPVADGAGEDLFEDLAPPGEPAPAARPATPARDLWLQTELAAERLQGRLLRLYYDARTHYEERGVNVLYLALGFLEWYEAGSQQPRHAPLILVPVRLERGSAIERFRLWFAEEEIATNLSLAEKLRQDCGLALPEIDPAERLEAGAYGREVAEAVRPEARFRVHADDIVLGLFSFAKLLMYRDLDPASWPAEMALDQRPLLRALLADGFRALPEPRADEPPLDELLPPQGALHVLDADASQARAIEAARSGHNLLIQGPPGTGKSQTIANLIAAAVHDGKTVLFVAEKMAALEVVKRRLDQIGLGELCQELHSRHSNKRALLEELERTLRLGAPRDDDPAERCAELAAARARLNRHAERLHRPLGNAGVTPYEAIGRLAELTGRGETPPPVTLPGACHWQRAELRERRDQVAALARRVVELGVPAQHPWRGVGLAALLPSDHQAIRQAVEALREPAGLLCRAAVKLQEWLGVTPVMPTLEQLERMSDACASLAALPDDVDAAALGDPVWRRERRALAELVAAGEICATARGELRELITEAAWSLDLGAVRRDLAAHGRSWLRWLNPAWRRARAAWRGIATGHAPVELPAQLAVLDRLVDAQECRARIAAEDGLGRAAFGRLWAGEASDWRRLGAVLAWRRDLSEPALLSCLLRLLAEVGDREPPILLAEHSARLLDKVAADWSDLVERLQLDLAEAFGEQRAAAVAVDRIAERLAQWAEQPDALRLWLGYGAQKRQIVGLGLSRLAQQLHQGGLPAGRALDAFDQAFYEAQLRQAFEAEPALAAFAGPEQERLVERFQELDRERIQSARREVAAAHHGRLPQRGGEIGQLGLLEREFAKKRRHLPIRQLLARAGQPIQAIKPVLMMSPLSVAEFLAPGALRFNLVVIDEASQVEPVDAFGALARGTQLVVVGDQRQLPPSPFFKAGVGADDDPAPGDNDSPPTADLESILGACTAAGMPERMLRWHYRSRHPSLIAVSNREFYDERLHVVPSPFASHERLGLVFRHVADGRFERGGSGINRREAEAVARAVIAHARAAPELSLGVGCFSLRQRDAILHQLEHLWREEPPAVREFFASAKAEPFFVKNLETIQGDERDVILISVGYGRDPSGHLSMSFGPLNHEGGERRLNVLITRARARLEVFASITADDIDLERARGRGVAVLKTFLAYAATGVLGVAQATDRGFDSPFEAAVARTLSGLGHQVDSQIGVAGLFVDLAIRDPARPGRYLLGIECDGAAYHSALWARDRDRLRQQVLEDQGWILHRVWSADWLRDPEGEVRRIAAALEDAKARWAARDESLEPEVAFVEADDAGEEPLAREAAGEAVETTGGGAEAYIEAAFELATEGEPHRLPPATMADAVVRIVEVEGPVHGEEVARRVTRLAGLERTGRRIAEAVGRGLARAVREQRLVRDGRFYALPDTTPAVRDRSQVRAASLRRPEMLPPAEIQAAILQVSGSHYGATGGEIALEVGRMLGFQATGARLRTLIETEVERLLANGRLDRQGPSLVPAGQREPLPAA
jgi:very-short-patch-repair endonuclease/DNA polymerase III delta prime subunit